MARLRVVMPVHNGGSFLDDAILSVLCDLPSTDAELVVVDDGSTDMSPSVIARHAAADCRITTIRNDSASGVSRALNTGILHGGPPPDYVAIAEHDDVTLPGRFAAQMAAFEGDARLGAVSCVGRYIGPDGRIVGRVASGPSSPESFANQRNEGRAILVPHPCVMYRAAALDSCGLYDATFDGAQDLELLNRMIYTGGWSVQLLPTQGIHYRMHSASMSFARMRTQRVMDQYIWQRNRASLDGESFPCFESWLANRRLTTRQRLTAARRDQGALMFRRAGLAWLARRRVSFAVNLAGAAILHPRWVALKARRLRGGSTD